MDLVYNETGANCEIYGYYIEDYSDGVFGEGKVFPSILEAMRRCQQCNTFHTLCTNYQELLYGFKVVVNCVCFLTAVYYKTFGYHYNMMCSGLTYEAHKHGWTLRKTRNIKPIGSSYSPNGDVSIFKSCFAPTKGKIRKLLPFYFLVIFNLKVYIYLLKRNKIKY